MEQHSDARSGSMRLGFSQSKRAANLLRWAMISLIVLCWLLGGVTQDSTAADEILQLLALPVLVLALTILARRRLTGVQRLALSLAIAIVALPAWQLLPLPTSWVVAGDMRLGIAADFASAGIQNIPSNATLSTFATEHALWSLMPALAIFLGALAISSRQLRTMVRLVLILALGSALFAFFQLSLPDGSPLLLFTQWGRNFGGLFANTNHQGIALTMGAVIAAALFMSGRNLACSGDDNTSRWYWAYGFLCVACILMVPLANGTAAMILVMVGLLVLLIMQGALDWPSVRRRRGSQLGVAASLVVAVIVIASSLAWKNVDEDRHTFARTTTELGLKFAPLGAGIGNFESVYAQYAPSVQARREVINHAHNEYAQWWLEAGIPALLVLSVGLSVFCWLGWQILRRMPSRRLRTVGAAAWTSLLMLLMHSLVDYPLRTTALMTTFGLLAGLLFNAVNASRQDQKDHQQREMDTKPA